MVKITYKHWTKDKVLEVIGTMPDHLNNETSERYVIQTSNGLEDVIKKTVISIERIDTD